VAISGSLLHNSDTICDRSIIVTLLSILYALISKHARTTFTAPILTVYFVVYSMTLCNIKDSLRWLDMSKSYCHRTLLPHYLCFFLEHLHSQQS